jgi:tetratricopeptide (TPR) repeat protein
VSLAALLLPAFLKYIARRKPTSAKVHDKLVEVLMAVPKKVLDDLDADCACGRPLTQDGIVHGISVEQRRQLFKGSEDWRKGELLKHELKTICDEIGACIGFSEMCLVQMPEQKQCRICFEGESEGELLGGCACRGSLKYIHAECLRQQQEHRGSTVDSGKCDLCLQSFHGRAAARMSDISTGKLSGMIDSDPRIHAYKIQTATQLWQSGKYEEAVDLFRSAIDGIEGESIQDPDLRARFYCAHHNLSLCYLELHKFGLASEHMQIAEDGISKSKGSKHELVLKCRHNEALIKQEQGRNKEALALNKTLLEDRRQLLGAKHIDTLKTAINLGMALYRDSQYDEAIPLMRQTLEGLEQINGRQHPFTLTCMMNLSLALSKQQPGDEEAMRLACEAADKQLLAHGPDMEETWISWRDLALVLKDARQFCEAERSMRRALHGYQMMYGFGHGKTKEVQQLLSAILDDDARHDEANELRKECAAQIVTKADEAPTPQDNGPIVAFIMNLYIEPKYRRRGHGKAQVDYWKAQARKASAESLQVLVKSTESIGFFLDKCGMIKVGERSLGREGPTYAQLHLAL